MNPKEARFGAIAMAEEALQYAPELKPYMIPLLEAASRMAAGTATKEEIDRAADRAEHIRLTCCPAAADRYGHHIVGKEREAIRRIGLANHAAKHAAGAVVDALYYPLGHWEWRDDYAAYAARCAAGARRLAAAGAE